LMYTNEDLPVNTRRKAVVDVVRQNLSEVDVLRQEKSVSAKMKAAHAEQTRKIQERRAAEAQQKKEIARSEIISKLEKERRELQMIQRRRTKKRSPSAQQQDPRSRTPENTPSPPHTAVQQTAFASLQVDPVPVSKPEPQSVQPPLFESVDREQLDHSAHRSWDFEFSPYRVAEAEVPSELLQQAHRNIHHKNIARSLGYTMKGLEWNRILRENRSYVRNLCVYLEKQKNNNTHVPS